MNRKLLGRVVPAFLVSVVWFAAVFPLFAAVESARVQIDGMVCPL